MSLVKLDTKEKIIEGVAHLDKTKWVKSLDKLISTTLIDKEGYLYKDIKSGKVINKVDLVACEIYSGKKRLIEVEQRFANGKVTNRNQPVGGKIAEGESPEEAIIKEISEEMNIPIFYVKEEFKQGKIKFNVKTINNVESVMYKGMHVESTRYEFKWELPLSLYKDVYQEITPEKVSTFKWVNN